ncbi:MAG: HD domain-containing protein [Candidatus Omnitrophica bacterium]|nr:HD domain-containing protein [Candidatus Omnitrophota bacterium]
MIRSYQQAIRDIAKVMVRVKNPTRLLKIITRYLYREMQVKNTAMAIYDKLNQRYVFYDSRGDNRVPKSLIKLDLDNPLVRWFMKHEKRIMIEKDCITTDLIDNMLADGQLIEQDPTLGPRLEKMKETMRNLSACACFPGYYKKDLLGILFVGSKNGTGHLCDDELLFLQTLASDASMAIKTAEYQEALLNKIKALEESLGVIRLLRQKDREKYLQTIIALANTVDAKDSYTCGHHEEVEKWGLMCVEFMNVKFNNNKREILSTALRLHDVGKLGVPDEILHKKGKLTEEEWVKMKDHVRIGAKILEHHDDFKTVAKIILHHHENFDGSGYPYGLKGEEIPLESRIISVVDAFHAMISDRPYRKGLPYDEAIAELKKWSGRQFDPSVVEAFLKVLQKSIHVE